MSVNFCGLMSFKRRAKSIEYPRKRWEMCDPSGHIEEGGLLAAAPEDWTCIIWGVKSCCSQLILSIYTMTRYQAVSHA